MNEKLFNNIGNRILNSNKYKPIKGDYVRFIWDSLLSDFIKDILTDYMDTFYLTVLNTKGDIK